MAAPEGALDLGQALGTHRAAGRAFEALDQAGDGQAGREGEEHVEVIPVRLDGGDGGPKGGG